MKLSRVTVTGADDSFEPALLGRLAGEYPFVEWGILVHEGGNYDGAPRFPSTDWMAELLRMYAPGELNIAVHVCGSWVRAACAGDWDWWLDPMVHPLLVIAQRVQLNFHSYRHKVELPAFSRAVARYSSRQIILQGDGVNDHIITATRDVAENAAVLHDRSGGAGKLPEAGPAPLENMDNGYAGGLSASNVAEQLKKIEDVVGDRTIWIDAESRLRTSDDSALSQTLVHEYLEEASRWATL